MAKGVADWRPIQRGGPLREQVRAALEDLIIHGVLEPGEHMREETLAERLEVSRQPVREALQMLAKSRFVDLRSGRGAFVHVPTRTEVNDVFHVRALLEGESARLAAGRITPADCNRLGEICDAGTDAVETGDKRILVDLNRDFHELVTQAAGNEVLAAMLAEVQLRIDWYLASIIIDRAPVSWRQHREIYLAIATPDPDRAATLMADHVDHTRRLLDDKYGPTA